jgi:hypothetical protein
MAERMRSDHGPTWGMQSERRARRHRTAVTLLSALVSATVIVASAACSSSATGVDACRSIEEARCRNAQACGISLTQPVSRDGREVDSCIRFYDDACKHGLASNANPSSADVNACVNAINAGVCSVVVSPETDPACSFLVPVVAADTGTDEAEAASDAGDASDAADAHGG